MNKEQKFIVIDNLVDNLPTLRKRLGLSQENLSVMLGIGRSTLAAIEIRKRPMTWNMFLSCILIFTKNKETDMLLNAMGIYTDELNDLLKNRIG